MQPNSQQIQSPPAAPPPLSEPAIQPINRHKDMLEEGERVLTVVRRYPIGIAAIYAEALAGVIAIAAILLVVLPGNFKNLPSGASTLIFIGMILGVAVLIFFLFAATYVYRQCRMLITDRGLVDIRQSSLFVRKTARLSFSNVEDVSAAKSGILPTVLDYGTLLVQTAGAVDNFEFKYCPNPTHYADIIIEAREHYAQSLKNGGAD